MKINLKVYTGYIHGALQPSVKVQISTDPDNDDINFQYLSRFLADFNFSTENFDFDHVGETINSYSAPELLIAALDFINHHCGDSRFTKILLRNIGAHKTFFIPTISPDITIHNLREIVRLYGNFRKGRGSKLTLETISRQRERMARFLPLGTNNLNFIRAAINYNIPYKIIDQRHIVYGYGKSSVILNSSLTEHESVTGVSLAKSKVVSNRFLQMSGLPVTSQASVKTLEEAKLVADKFGYPVVLKPESEEQGRGIFANIIDAMDLEECYALNKEKYNVMLVEKHIVGDHYRIDFAEGLLIKAVRRKPPHIVGDGIRSVRDLIFELNREPERIDRNSSKSTVEIDDDLIRCLRNQRMTTADIPEQGRQVYLKSISNLSRGGEQVHVENVVHNENLELCKAIARIFRLRIIGVDIISPDISVPWHRNGAKICEVNAQPQLGRSGTDVYWRILKKYINPACQINVEISRKSKKNPAYIYDRNKDYISIELSPEEIKENGMPTQYYDKIKFTDDITSQEKSMVNSLIQSKRPQYP